MEATYSKHILLLASALLCGGIEYLFRCRSVSTRSLSTIPSRKSGDQNKLVSSVAVATHIKLSQDSAKLINCDMQVMFWYCLFCFSRVGG